MYTNINEVRTMSWLDDEVNISDPLIKNKIIIASGMVDSAIGNIYTLPIPYRHNNTLTFGWLWTWSGTMAIIINGTTYNISILNWDTPDIAADKFRLVAIDSNDFIIDWLGLWEEVTIISKTNSDTDTATAFAEVNITSAPDTEWISAVIWIRSIIYPPTLREITTEIATALLFIDIYWIEWQDTWKDGETRMDRVNAILEKLQWVSETWFRIHIFDEVTNVELNLSATGQSDSHPNDTSDIDPDDPTSPKAFMNKIF